MSNIHSKQISKKVTILMGWMFIGSSLLFSRLIYLQIMCADYFRERSSHNFLRMETISASRGAIIDCHDKLLALNRPIFSIYWQGTGAPFTSPELQKTIACLMQIFPNLKNNPTIQKSLKKAEQSQTRYLIADDIQFNQLCQIKEQLPCSSSIRIESQEKRFYPYGSKSTHIVGYVTRQNNLIQGQIGIEKMCDTILSGTPGIRLKTINSVGSILSELIVQEAVPGKSVKTTIDIDMQKIGDLVFPDHYIGSLILFDPATGALRTIISKPSFCPHLFLDPISSENWQALQKNNPFLNRAITAYPPGSIFKLVSISAALENGLIKEDDTWTCRGYCRFANRRYWCHKHSGHGVLDTTHAVGQSCNILFFEIAKQMNIDTFAEYAAIFGLGSKTGYALAEKEGLVPTKKWKREAKGEPWWPGETLSAAIGQSYLLATPLQVARMISSIFTGYLARPRILEEEPIEKTRLELREETISFLKRSMKAVITHGTGKKMNKLKDIEIYAKTSTAQISALGKQILDHAYLEHGWFVTHFKYKDYDPLVLVVLVENAGTAQVPAIVARDFLIAYKKYMDAENQT